MKSLVKWALGALVVIVCLAGVVISLPFIAREQLKSLSIPTQNLNKSIVVGDVSAARESIAEGADVNNEVLDFTPLHRATVHCSPQILALLLDHGAQINHRNGPAGRTALHEASLKGNLDCIMFLVDRGADINLPNDNGRTPLFYAVSPPPPLLPPPNREQVAQYLRSKGALL